MFASNTGISTSHNDHIILNKGEKRTYRVFLRPVECGKRAWRFFFSNSVDSTWDNGSVSRANIPGGRLEITSSSIAAAEDVSKIGSCHGILWEDRPSLIVESGDCVQSDPVMLDVPQNGYIVFTWTLKALCENCVLPVTPDSRALCQEEIDGVFRDEDRVALPDRFEADRSVTTKMIFIGDSITQGCQTPLNGYEQWAARIAMGIERDVAVWNIGLGFARAEDAASSGAWLKKAAQADIVNICLGVNDLSQHRDNARELIENLRTAIALLKRRKHAPHVVLFTVPPFDWDDSRERDRQTVNAAIRENGLGADVVFDMAKILQCSDTDVNHAFFGGHPDGRGGAAVAGEYLTRFWVRNRDRLLEKK